MDSLWIPGTRSVASMKRDCRPLGPMPVPVRVAARPENRFFDTSQGTCRIQHLFADIAQDRRRRFTIDHFRQTEGFGIHPASRNREIQYVSRTIETASAPLPKPYSWMPHMIALATGLTMYGSRRSGTTK